MPYLGTYTDPSIQESLKYTDPSIQETLKYSGPRVYTEAPTYETAQTQFMQPPEKYRLHAATSSIAQITPQPISEIRHIVNRITTGTQTTIRDIKYE